MTSGIDNPTRLTPWLSVWLRPRATIDYVLATEPGRYVLLLAALDGIAQIVADLIDEDGFWREFLDWRVIAAVGLAGVVLGILSLYIFSAILRWISRPFGGQATAVAVRAAFAWGAVPLVIGVSIIVAFGAGLNVSGLLSQKQIVAAFQAACAIPIIWALVCVLLMYGRAQRFGFWRTVISCALASMLVLSIPLSIRIFLFEPFTARSASMVPTFFNGDYFYVSKSAYGYSRYTLPFSPPLFYGRVFAAEPQRGDVVTFRVPKDTSVAYVKRIVGLPGDRIQMIKGVLQINGQPVAHERVEDFVADDGSHAKRYRETLPNGVSYTTIDVTENGFYDNTPLVTVPAGHYFVLGDNLDNSMDSRVLSQVGYVPFENLIGRATIIYFSVPPESGAIRYERIGAIIH
jgi:signal peptidase I